VLSVVYTGTHDNDTTLGWWALQHAEQRRNVVPHLLDPTEPMPWALVRLAMASVATLAVVPAQDLLELGSESRMNTPGTPTGNWTWQAFEDDFDDTLAGRLRELVAEHRRLA
jgi:4-alpha-glucanotransferase